MKRELEFWFDGPHAAIDAQSLSDFLKSELPKSLEWQMRVVKSSKTRLNGDLMQIVLLLLALLGGIENALKLADRIIGWAKKYRERNQRSLFVVLWPDDEPVALEQVKAEEFAYRIEGRPPKKNE